MPKANNFKVISQRILENDCPKFLEELLPEGTVNGDEYECASIAGGKGKTFKVNMSSGKWAEFNAEDGDHKGNDLVSLYAAVNSIDQGEALIQLSKKYPSGGKKEKASRGTAARKQILPVPSDSPSAPKKHPTLGKPSKQWKYLSGDGELLGYVCRFDFENGKKSILPLTFVEGEWIWEGFPKPRPLFGLQKLNKKPNLPIIIAEGEKAAAAGQKKTKKHVVLTWLNGSNAVDSADWTPLKGRDVYIWPDKDSGGLKAALQIVKQAKKCGFEVKGIVDPDPSWPETADLADFPDWDSKRFNKELQEHLLSAEEFRKKHGTIADTDDDDHEFPFDERDDGLYYTGRGEEGTWVCSPLKVLTKARNEENRGWGCYVEVVDPDGVSSKEFIPMKLLAGTGNELREILLNLGLRFDHGLKSKQLIAQYLNNHPTDKRMLCVDRIGWHGNLFATPYACIAPEGEEIETVTMGSYQGNAFKTKGSLEDWKTKVASLAQGNTRLLFAMSAMFAASLIRIMEQESGGFHFVGNSSTGKTTVLNFAGSVIGGGEPNGVLKSWRSTDNALESVATMHCDCALLLDEIGQATSKTVKETAYMLANGQGKGRANRTGVVRNVQEWRTLFLSTGEVKLAEKIQEDGYGRAKAGQEVRMVDIPVDAGKGIGAFENLHGQKDAASFAVQLKERARKYYGTAFTAFVEALVQDRDRLVTEAKKYMVMFKDIDCPPGADGQVKRVADRFGLVAAAGELAIEMGIVPWKENDAYNAARKCFQSWIETRGGTEAAEIREGIKQVRRFFQEHGDSRFQTGKGYDGRTYRRAGFLWKHKRLGQSFYLVFPDVFRDEVCTGFDPTMVAKRLKDLGLLVTENDRLQKTVRVPGETRKAKFYVIKEVILDEVSTGPCSDKPNLKLANKGK